MQNQEKSLHNTPEGMDNRGELVNAPATVQVNGIMGNSLNAQHGFAFVINLDRQFSKVNLENSQIIDRSLDYDFKLRLCARVTSFKRTMLIAKNGLYRFYGKRRPGPVYNTLKYLIHGPVMGKQQVAAVLCLID